MATPGNFGVRPRADAVNLRAVMRADNARLSGVSLSTAARKVAESGESSPPFSQEAPSLWSQTDALSSLGDRDGHSIPSSINTRRLVTGFENEERWSNRLNRCIYPTDERGPEVIDLREPTATSFSVLCGGPGYLARGRTDRPHSGAPDAALDSLAPVPALVSQFFPVRQLLESPTGNPAVRKISMTNHLPGPGRCSQEEPGAPGGPCSSTHTSFFGVARGPRSTEEFSGCPSSKPPGRSPHVSLKGAPSPVFRSFFAWPAHVHGGFTAPSAVHTASCNVESTSNSTRSVPKPSQLLAFSPAVVPGNREPNQRDSKVCDNAARSGAKAPWLPDAPTPWETPTGEDGSSMRELCREPSDCHSLSQIHRSSPVASSERPKLTGAPRDWPAAAKATADIREPPTCQDASGLLPQPQSLETLPNSGHTMQGSFFPTPDARSSVLEALPETFTVRAAPPGRTAANDTDFAALNSLMHTENEEAHTRARELACDPFSPPTSPVLPRSTDATGAGARGSRPGIARARLRVATKNEFAASLQRPLTCQSQRPASPGPVTSLLPPPPQPNKQAQLPSSRVSSPSSNPELQPRPCSAPCLAVAPFCLSPTSGRVLSPPSVSHSPSSAGRTQITRAESVSVEEQQIASASNTTIEPRSPSLQVDSVDAKARSASSCLLSSSSTLASPESALSLRHPGSSSFPQSPPTVATQRPGFDRGRSQGFGGSSAPFGEQPGLPLPSLDCSGHTGIVELHTVNKCHNATENSKMNSDVSTAAHLYEAEQAAQAPGQWDECHALSASQNEVESSLSEQRLRNPEHRTQEGQHRSGRDLRLERIETNIRNSRRGVSEPSHKESSLSFLENRSRSEKLESGNEVSFSVARPENPLGTPSCCRDIPPDYRHQDFQRTLDPTVAPTVRGPAQSGSRPRWTRSEDQPNSNGNEDKQGWLIADKVLQPSSILDSLLLPLQQVRRAPSRRADRGAAEGPVSEPEENGACLEVCSATFSRKTDNELRKSGSLSSTDRGTREESQYQRMLEETSDQQLDRERQCRRGNKAWRDLPGWFAGKVAGPQKEQNSQAYIGTEERAAENIHTLQHSGSASVSARGDCQTTATGSAFPRSDPYKGNQIEPAEKGNDYPAAGGFVSSAREGQSAVTGTSLEASPAGLAGQAETTVSAPNTAQQGEEGNVAERAATVEDWNHTAADEICANKSSSEDQRSRSAREKKAEDRITRPPATNREGWNSERLPEHAAPSFPLSGRRENADDKGSPEVGHNPGLEKNRLCGRRSQAGTNAESLRKLRGTETEQGATGSETGARLKPAIRFPERKVTTETRSVGDPEEHTTPVSSRLDLQTKGRTDLLTRIARGVTQEWAIAPAGLRGLGSKQRRGVEHSQPSTPRIITQHDGDAPRSASKPAQPDQKSAAASGESPPTFSETKVSALCRPSSQPPQSYPSDGGPSPGISSDLLPAPADLRDVPEPPLTALGLATGEENERTARPETRSNYGEPLGEQPGSVSSRAPDFRKSHAALESSPTKSAPCAILEVAAEGGSAEGSDSNEVPEWSNATSSENWDASAVRPSSRRRLDGAGPCSEVSRCRPLFPVSPQGAKRFLGTERRTNLHTSVAVQHIRRLLSELEATLKETPVTTKTAWQSRRSYLGHFLGWTSEQVQLRLACVLDIEGCSQRAVDVMAAEKVHYRVELAACSASESNGEGLSTDRLKETPGTTGNDVRPLGRALEDVREPLSMNCCAPAAAYHVQLFDFDLFPKRKGKGPRCEPTNGRASLSSTAASSVFTASAAQIQEIGAPGCSVHSVTTDTVQGGGQQQEKREATSQGDLESLLGQLTAAETIGVVCPRRQTDHQDRQKRSTRFSRALLISRVRVKCVAAVPSAPHLLIGASDRGTFVLWDLSQPGNTAKAPCAMRYCCSLDREVEDCEPVSSTSSPDLPAVLQAFYGIEKAAEGALLTLGFAKRERRGSDAPSRGLPSRRPYSSRERAFSSVHSMARLSPHHTAVVRLFSEFISDKEDFLDDALLGKDVFVALDGCGMVSVWEVIHKPFESGHGHGLRGEQAEGLGILSAKPSAPVSLSLRRRFLLADVGSSFAALSSRS